MPVGSQYALHSVDYLRMHNLLGRVSKTLPAPLEATAAGR